MHIKEFLTRKYYLLLFLCLGTVLLFFHFRGFPTVDEGWVLQATSRLIKGEIPYKNFQFIYTPGVLYANALGFFIFGEHALAGRLIALTNSLYCVIILFNISKNLKLSKFSTFLLSSLYVFWGPAHINFIWTVIFNISCALTLIYLELKRAGSNSTKLIDLTTGFVLALNIIFKQNLGLALFLAYFFYIFLNGQIKNTKRLYLNFIGFLSPLLIQFVYMIKTGSLLIFLKDFYFLTYYRVFLKGALNSRYPWEYGNLLIYKISKTIFYLLPLLITIFAFVKTFKRKREEVNLILLAVVFYYFLSIRPTTDYLHLTPLLAFSSLPLIIIYEKSKKGFKFILSFFVLAFVAFSAYSATFKNYYRWHAPLAKQNTYSSNSKIRLWVDPVWDKQAEKLSKYYDNHANEDEYTLIYSYEPTLYFILDKKNPTRYDDLHAGYVNDEIESEVINSLKSDPLKLVTIQSGTKNSMSNISKYIQDNYTPSLSTKLWIVLKAN